MRARACVCGVVNCNKENNSLKNRIIPLKILNTLNTKSLPFALTSHTHTASIRIALNYYRFIARGVLFDDDFDGHEFFNATTTNRIRKTCEAKKREKNKYESMYPLSADMRTKGEISMLLKFPNLTYTL